MSKRNVTSIELPPDLHAQIEQEAKETGVSRSQLIRHAIASMLGVCPTCGQRARKRLARVA